MPLRVCRRRDTGTLWIVGTVRPAGAERGVRIRRSAGTNDRRLADEEAAAIEADTLRRFHLGERRPDRRFGEAARSYLRHAPRGPSTRALVRRLLLFFGDVSLSALDQDAADRARAAILAPGHAPATFIRNILAPLRAILLHAAVRGWCDPPRFDVPPVPDGRTAFLLPGQLVALRAAAAEHLRPLLTWAVCTGCRMSETLGLDWPEVDLLAGRVILWEGETKGGARRVVELPPAAVAALAELPHRDGRVFRTPAGDAYPDSRESGAGGQIKTGWRAAMRRAGLTGFTPHDLRHTWATWHYALHRDLLLLTRDGRWSSVTLAERYAHLMPAGHGPAIREVWGLPPERHVTDTRRSAQG